MRLILFVCSFIGLSVVGSSQSNRLSTYLKFDTILYFNNYSQWLQPQKANHDFNFISEDGIIYYVVNNKKTEGNFCIFKLNARYEVTDSFLLINALKGKYTGGSVVDFNIKNNKAAILTYNGWQLFELNTGVLINSKKFTEAKQFYHRINITNDSLLVLARAHTNPTIGNKDAVSIYTYDYIADKVISDVSIKTSLPQLSAYGPNNRILFYKNHILIADFNDYKVYHIEAGKFDSKVIVNYTKYHSDTSFTRELNESVNSKKTKSALNTLIEDNFFNNMLILHDLNMVGEGELLLRVTIPLKDRDSTDLQNDQFHLWVNNELTGKFELKKVLYNESSYENNDDGILQVSKARFYKSLKTNSFFISNGKLYVFYWSAGVYPISMNKRDLKITEAKVLYENGPTPTILIYEIKSSFY